MLSFEKRKSDSKTILISFTDCFTETDAHIGITFLRKRKEEYLLGSMPRCPVSLDFLSCWDVSVWESTCSVGDLGLIPGLGRSPGRGYGNPLKYSYLENPMDRGAWWVTVHGVTRESDTTEVT